MNQQIAELEHKMQLVYNSAQEVTACSKIPDMIKESLLSINQISNEIVTESRFKQFEQKHLEQEMA